MHSRVLKQKTKKIKIFCIVNRLASERFSGEVSNLKRANKHRRKSNRKQAFSEEISSAVAKFCDSSKQTGVSIISQFLKVNESVREK